MGDFTVQAAAFGSGAALSSAGPESLTELFDFGITGTGFAAAAWPTANKAIFVPLHLSRTVTVKQVLWSNGGTVSGNVDVGIYDTSGARLVSLGSTAQAGTSANQIGNIADTTLKPGSYFMAMVMDNTTGLPFRASGIGTQLLQVAGVQEATSSFPLPSTVTFANPSSAYIPLLVLLLNATA